MNRERSVAGQPGSCDRLRFELAGSREEPFEFDEKLTARDVDRLIELSNVIDRNNLTCEAVCENIYLDMNPKGGATSVYNCTLTFDGEFNGDPEEVVGSMQCDGLGIPQYCSD